MSYLRVLLVGLFLINAQLWAKGVASSICKETPSASLQVKETFLLPIVPTPEELELLEMVNSVRKSPLWPNNNLWTSARFHSQEMVDNDYFSHDSKDASGRSYETFQERIARFDYKSEGGAGENIACARSVSEAFSLWKQSGPHWGNIINPNYTEIGVGIAQGGRCGKMFTLVFGSRSLYFDLAIYDIFYDKTSKVLKAVVHNLGKTHTYPVWVRFYKGEPSQRGEVIGEELITPILPTDEMDSVSIEYLPLENQDVYAIVDPDNIFPDENRGNNQAHREILAGIAQSPYQDKIRVYCQPNPFKAVTSIKWIGVGEGPISLEIYEATGRLIRTLAKTQSQEPRAYKVAWDGKDDKGKSLSSGIYFWRLKVGEYVAKGKAILR